MGFAPSGFSAAFVCLCSHAAFAQTSANGSIRGYIRDPQEAVLPGTTITATSPTVPTIFTAVSDKEGYYRLLELPPGEYTFTAELQGFARFARPQVVVRAGLNLGVDVEMKVGNVAEIVNVTANTPMLESEKATSALNVSGDFQRSVPLSSRRSWAEFLALTPGIASATPSGGAS